ncbi:MAG: hypothetical protein J5556_07060 [Deltaproteobacteria bacterium]|nr:hypothetical protein [Deltaproteobacteria bacterium]
MTRGCSGVEKRRYNGAVHPPRMPDEVRRLGYNTLPRRVQVPSPAPPGIANTRMIPPWKGAVLMAMR